MNHLRRAIKNPYLWILLVPLVAFLTVVWLRAEPDEISVWVRIGVFLCLAYLTARYAGRTPRLMWEGNFTPESRNITGWGLFLLSQMATQVLAVLSISLSVAGIRPGWLSSTYYSPALVSLGLVGLSLVASSIPKLPMPPFFGGKGFSGAASVIIAVLSAAGLSIVSHFPAVMKAVASLFSALVHAV